MELVNWIHVAQDRDMSRSSGLWHNVVLQ